MEIYFGKGNDWNFVFEFYNVIIFIIFLLVYEDCFLYFINILFFIYMIFFVGYCVKKIKGEIYIFNFDF